MRSGRVTSLDILYNQRHMRWRIAAGGVRLAACRGGRGGDARRSAARAGADRGRGRDADTMRPEILGTHGIVAAGRHYSVVGRRPHPAAGRQRGRRRRRVGARRVGLRDLALRLRRRSADDDLRREDEGDHRHQRPGPGAEGGDAGAVRREGVRAGQRPARRDDPGDARRDGARARSQGHDAPRAGDAAGDRARRRLPDVRVPAQLPRSASARRPNSTSGRRRPTIPDGRVPEVGEIFRQPNLARTLRAIAAADKASFAKTHNRVTAIHAGRDAFYTGDIAHRIADADKAAGGVFTYDDLASYHGKIEKPTTTSFHGYDVYKAGPVEPGAGAAADAEHPRRRRPAGVRRQLRRLHPPGARGDQARLRRSQRVLRRPGVRAGADDRPAVEGVRRRAARADRPAGLARTARRRSVPLRSGGEGAGRRATRRTRRACRRRRARATRPASTSSTRTATCSARRRARAGCSAARSSRATPACRCRTG